MEDSWSDITDHHVREGYLVAVHALRIQHDVVQIPFYLLESDLTPFLGVPNHVMFPCGTALIPRRQMELITHPQYTHMGRPPTASRCAQMMIEKYHPPRGSCTMESDMDGFAQSAASSGIPVSTIMFGFGGIIATNKMLESLCVTFMNTLQVVVLTGCHTITDITPLAQCPYLEILNIASTMVHKSDTIASVLRGCPKLFYLDISGLRMLNVIEVVDMMVEVFSVAQGGGKGEGKEYALRYLKWEGFHTSVFKEAFDSLLERCPKITVHF
eukprot:PhF_6_TR17416/c0_g1_i1/m.26653